MRESSVHWLSAPPMMLMKRSGHFLSDIKKVSEDEELYHDANTWRFSVSFLTHGYIGRFESLVNALQGLQDALRIEEELEFLIGEPRKRTSTTPTSDIAVGGSSNPGHVAKISFEEEDVKLRRARETIECIMPSFCRMYNTKFYNILEADSVLRPQEASNIAGKVYLIITNPPGYSELHFKEMKESEVDCIEENDMPDVVENMSNLLRPGWHVIIFCSQDETSNWIKFLNESTRSEENEEKDSQVDENTLIFTQKPSESFLNNWPALAGRESQSRLINVTMQAVHGMKLGCSEKAAKDMVRMKHFGYVHSRHLATTNVIHNVPRLPPLEYTWFNDEQ